MNQITLEHGFWFWKRPITYIQKHPCSVTVWYRKDTGERASTTIEYQLTKILLKSRGVSL